MSLLLERLQQIACNMPILLLGDLHSRRKVAKDFLSWRLCCNKNKYNITCGDCYNCNISLYDHADVWIILTEQEQKILIEESRAIINFLNTKAKFTDVKFVWIDDIENLNTHAAPSLLKTLEDSGALFVLGARNVQVLPKTLVSRCLRLQINDNHQEQLTTKEFSSILEQIIIYLHGQQDIYSTLENLAPFSAKIIYTNLWLIVVYSLKNMHQYNYYQNKNINLIAQNSSKLILWSILDEANRYLQNCHYGIRSDLELELEYILLNWKEGWQKKNQL